MWIGRWHEGPRGSDYLPGNTKDRLREVVPFSKEEWEQRQMFKTWDGLKIVSDTAISLSTAKSAPNLHEFHSNSEL